MEVILILICFHYFFLDVEYKKKRYLNQFEPFHQFILSLIDVPRECYNYLLHISFLMTSKTTYKNTIVHEHSNFRFTLEVICPVVNINVADADNIPQIYSPLSCFPVVV